MSNKFTPDLLQRVFDPWTSDTKEQLLSSVRNSLYCFLSVNAALLQYCTVDGTTKQLRIRRVYQCLALLLVSLLSVTGSARTDPEEPCSLSLSLTHRQHWNRSRGTLFLVSLSHTDSTVTGPEEPCSSFLTQTALEQVQRNLAPHLSHRQHWNKSREEPCSSPLSLTGSTGTDPEEPCSSSLSHRQRWNRFWSNFVPLCSGDILEQSYSRKEVDTLCSCHSADISVVAYV
uniref:Uncharacterized protein n=1 Tax=Timema shepardi TaxID=629360 RepID=A0A7R9B0E3_TIMSH|nr:unnamed protein product [Timema shepardi]